MHAIDWSRRTVVKARIAKKGYQLEDDHLDALTRRDEDCNMCCSWIRIALMQPMNSHAPLP